MAFEQYIKDKKAFVFGLDNVLYPEKDYLLQVYYLFSEFLSYTEQLDSAKIIEFMQSAYQDAGAQDIFEKTSAKFNIPSKYKANFLLLHQNARLPLKLLLFQQVLLLLQEIVLERKAIFLLVDGDPIQQLNKIKQMEWNGLEKYLKVYFSAEFEPKPSAQSIAYLIGENLLEKEDILMIGNTLEDEAYAQKVDINFIFASKL